MKRVKNSVRMIALAVMVCCLLTMGVFATENGSVWIAETDMEGGTAAFVITDAVVTDGVVAVRYDADALTYQGVSVNTDYVAMHAVNADEAGVVMVSWVAPAALDVEGNEWLIQVDFAGTADQEITLEGVLSGVEIGAAPVVNKTELEKAVLEALAMNAENYTAESWAALAEALAAYEAVLADPTATQEEVDAAAEALRAAIDALEPVAAAPGEADKAELTKTIDIAEGLEQSNYTEASWKALEDALKEAKAVFADADATQEAVDAAAAALKAAIDGLKLVEVEVEVDTVDKTELAKTIDTAEGLKKGDYTSASWKALQKALKEAKAVLADADATQEAVDAAAAALKAAIAGLELDDVADTGDNSDLLMPIVMAVVSIAAIVAVLVVMMKKKEGKA